MPVPDVLNTLIGTWQGRNRLWHAPDEPVYESEASATVSPAALGKFIAIHYFWSIEGEPAEGFYLISQLPETGAIQALWIDSWHMGEKWMICQGTSRPDGPVRFQGPYSAPTGPDWGWRTAIERLSSNAFRILMYNVSPEGQEALAVELAFSRS